MCPSTPWPFETLAQPLCGAAHESLCDSLVAAFHQVSSRSRPRLVDLTGPPGSGKTKIVQAAYERLAVGDAYWPERIDGGRKAIRPTRMFGHESPSWIWFGLSCVAGPDGGHVPILRAQTPGQLVTHAAPMLLSARRRAAGLELIQRAARGIGSLLGIELLHTVIDIVGRLEELADAADALRSLVVAGPESVFLDDHVDEDAIAEVLAILDLLAAARIPLVLAVEDAHWAERTVTELFRRILEQRLPVLMVTTSWPSITSSQQRTGARFGFELAELQRTSPIERWPVPPLATNDLAALTLASLSTSRSAAARTAAVRLARRAQGNPLHLAFLLQTVRLNDIDLDAVDPAHVDALSSSFDGALRDVWPHLPDDARWSAMAAAVVGTPTTVRALDAATRALLPHTQAHLESGVTTAVALQWMVVDPDPFGADAFVRFADPVYAEAAAAASLDLTRDRRDKTCAHIIEAAMFSVPRQSDLACRVLERQAGQLLMQGWCPDMATTAIAVLLEHGAVRLWNRGERAQAIERLGKAAGIAVTDVYADAYAAEIVQRYAECLFTESRLAEACDAYALLPGDPLIAHRASELAFRERWAEVLDTVVLALERAADDPASLKACTSDYPAASNEPILLALEAADRAFTAGDRMDALPRIAGAVATLLERQHHALPLEVLQKAYQGIDQFDGFTTAQRAALEQALPFDLQRAQSAPHEAHDAPDGADDVMRLTTIALTGSQSDDLTSALAAARALVDRFGASHLALLGDVSSKAGDHRGAAEAYGRALATVTRSEPTDAWESTRLRRKTIVALAKSGRVSDAERELRQLERIAAATRFRSTATELAFASGWVFLARDALDDAATSFAEALEAGGHTSFFQGEVELALCLALGRLGRWADVHSITSSWSIVMRFKGERMSFHRDLWYWAALHVMAPAVAADEFVRTAFFHQPHGDLRTVAIDAATVLIAQIRDAILEIDPAPPHARIGWDQAQALLDTLLALGRRTDAEQLAQAVAEAEA